MLELEGRIKRCVSATCLPSLTGNPGGSFIWTNSLSLLKCLKGAMISKTFNSLENKSWSVQMEGRGGNAWIGGAYAPRRISSFNKQGVDTYDSMPRGKSWLMATVALKFFLLSLHTSSRPRCGALEETEHRSWASSSASDSCFGR